MLAYLQALDRLGMFDIQYSEVAKEEDPSLKR